jgi:hypothetical protein
MQFSIQQQGNNTFTVDHIGKFNSYILSRGGIQVESNSIRFADGSELTYIGNTIHASEGEALHICQGLVYRQNASSEELADAGYGKRRGGGKYGEGKNAAYMRPRRCDTVAQPFVCLSHIASGIAVIARNVNRQFSNREFTALECILLQGVIKWHIDMACCVMYHQGTYKPPPAGACNTSGRLTAQKG